MGCLRGLQILHVHCSRKRQDIGEVARTRLLIQQTVHHDLRTGDHKQDQERLLVGLLYAAGDLPMRFATLVALNPRAVIAPFNSRPTSLAYSSALFLLSI